MSAYMNIYIYHMNAKCLSILSNACFNFNDYVIVAEPFARA